MVARRVSVATPPFRQQASSSPRRQAPDRCRRRRCPARCREVRVDARRGGNRRVAEGLLDVAEVGPPSRARLPNVRRRSWGVTWPIQPSRTRRPTRRGVGSCPRDRIRPWGGVDQVVLRAALDAPGQALIEQSRDRHPSHRGERFRFPLVCPPAGLGGGLEDVDAASREVNRATPQRGHLRPAEAREPMTSTCPRPARPTASARASSWAASRIRSRGGLAAGRRTPLAMFSLTYRPRTA